MSRHQPTSIWIRICRFSAISLVGLGLIAGCSTTSEPKKQEPTSRVDVIEAVGFTITEQQSVSEQVELEYQQALHLLEQGLVDEGVAALERVTEAAPGLAAPYIDLGVAYHISGDLESAEAKLLRAIEINPAHPVAHNELGIIYRKTGRFADARNSYEAALDIYPGYHYARRNLAILCDLYLVDPECALSNYEAYMATVPGDEEVEIWIADLRLRTGNGED
jgi:Flp pilus assembly protein TadD